MTFFALTKEQAISLSKQQATYQEVKLSSINFNWGPPISGRVDVDRMVVWAKVKVGTPGKLFFQGTRYNLEWDINIEFEKVGRFKEIDSGEEYTLYTLSLSDEKYFPEAFVLRYDTETRSYYDNNMRSNYKISCYLGIGGSAYALEDNAILDLGCITNPTLYFKKINHLRPV